VEFLTKSKQIRTKLEVKYMLIKSKILYMDDDHYYLTPIPSYFYSVFAITEETLPQYEKDCNIEINYTITRETTIQEIQNALCKKMSKQVGLVCRNYFGIYLRTDSDFICIEDTAINVEHVLDLFHIKDNVCFCFIFSAYQGDIWREGQIRYYMHTREKGHNVPHVHVNISHEIDISINFLTGEILAGKIPPKYKKEIMDKIFNDDNQKKLIESWNCTTDGIKIDLNYSFGIVTADF